MKAVWKRTLLVAVTVAAVMAAAILVYVHTAAFRGALERRIESAVAERLGRDCRLRIESLRPLALRAEVADLEIAGRGERAFLALDEGTVDARWRMLLGGGLDLSELQLAGLLIDLGEIPSVPGKTDGEPARPPTTFADVMGSVRIDRASLVRGELRFVDESLAFGVVAAGLDAGLDREAGGLRYRLRVDAERGLVTLGDSEALPFAGGADAVLDSEGLRVSGLRLEGAGIDVRATGKLSDLATLSATADVEIEATTEKIPWKPLRDAGVRGTVSAEGSARATPPAFGVDLKLTSSRVAWRGWTAENLDLDLGGSEREWRSRFRFSTAGVDVEGDALGGPLPDLAPWSARVSLNSPDVDRVVRSVGDPRGPPVRGSVRGNLTARADTLDPGAIAATFEIDARDVGPREWPRVSISSRASGSFSGGRVALDRFDAEGSGLLLEGGGFADLRGRTDLRLDLRVEDASDALRLASPLLRVLSVRSPVPPPLDDLRGRLAFAGRLSGPGLADLRAGTARGDFSFDVTGLTAAGAEGLPVDAEGSLALDAGRVELRAATIRAPGAELAIEGRLDLDGTLDTRFRFDVDAIGDAGVRLLSELRALDVPGPRPETVAGVEGRLRLEGELRGSWRRPDGRIGLAVDGLRRGSDFPARDLRADLSLERGRAGGTVRLGDSESTATVHVDGGAVFEWPGEGTLRVELHEARPGWWAELLGKRLPARGRIDATAAVDLASLSARASVEVADGELAGLRFEVRGGEIYASRERLEVEGAELRALGGAVRLEGVLDAGRGGSELRARSTTFDLAETLRPFEMPLALDGALSFDARLTGSPLDPRVDARIEIGGLSVEGRRLPDLDGTVSYAKGGVEVDLEEPGGTSSLRGSAEVVGARPWKLSVRYPVRLGLGDLASPSADAPPLDFEARLLADLAGNGIASEDLAGRLELRDATLAVGDRRLVLRDGLEVELAAGVARVAPFEVGGADVDLRGSGELSVETPFTVSAEFGGVVPLEPLARLVPDLRAQGACSVDVRLRGSLLAPEWKGDVHFRDVRLTHPFVPAPVERLTATLKLAPEVWRVEDLSARLGGGFVEGAGEYATAGGDESGRLRVVLTGNEVRLPLAEGLRSELDGRLELEGRVGQVLTLAGKIDVARAAYVQDIDLRQRLLSRTRTVVAGAEVGGLRDRIRLDIDVEAPRSLYVRNNLAFIETTASLRVGGTAADPLVTGEVELLEGGSVFFRGVTYRVTRGTLEYVSDPPGNPALDIAGETSVASYDVTLSVTGRLADPKVELSSSPPLPQADIVALLMTGRTRDELAGSGGGLAETQAALYLSDNFTKDIEKTLTRSLGLDQVSIDPVLVAGETDPSARVTLGKALTGKTVATYSRALSGAQDDIYELRYQPEERFSLVGRRDEEGELSADALYTKRFYIGPRRPSAQAPRGVEDLRVVGVSVRGARTVAEKRLRGDLGLAPGDRFRKAVLLAGLDDIRDLYVERGFPEAKVDAVVAEEGDGVAVTVTVDEGRRVDVLVEGSKRARAVQRSVLELWQRSVFLDRIAEEAAALVRRELRERGYAGAEVECEVVASDPDRAQLKIAIERGPRVKVDEIVTEGNRDVDGARIREQMLTEEAGILRRGRLAPGLLEEDREAIRGLYFGLGYFDAEVGDPEITHAESGKRAVVRFRIDEGRRYRLGSVAFSGNEAFDGEALGKVAGLRAGEPYVDEDVRGARSRVRGHYDRRGYPEVRVDVTTELDREDARADVNFSVSEGERRTIGSVEIVGAGVTRPSVIRRELSVAPGDPLSADEVAASRQNLYRTGLFRSVGVVEEPGPDPDERSLTFKVEERPNLRTEAGIGYATDQGVRASVAVGHDNLFGRRVHGAAGARGSEVDWRVYALVRQPRLFGSRMQGLASTFLENEEKEGFEVRRAGSTLQVDGKAAKRNRRWFVGYGLQRVDVLDRGIVLAPGAVLPPGVGALIDPRAESTLTLGDANAGLVLGSRDDFAWPTRGNILQTKVSVFDSTLLSEAEFVRGFGQWSLHRKLNGRLVWSSGVRLGAAEPYGGDVVVPLSERFFAGGDNSIRGFERDSIVARGFPAAELAAAGAIVTESLGGNALLIVNQEIVATVADPLAVVVFYDAGNLYWRLEDLDATDLRHAAGLGLRVRTPVGPLRLEYGWKLDREPQESRGRLHFSVGIPF